MADLQFYVEYAIYKCFAKPPGPRRGHLCDNSVPNQAHSMYFETENFDKKDGFNSNAIFGRIIYEDEQRKKRCGDSIVVKLMENSQGRYKFMDIVFSNEIYAYSRIIPFFAKFNEGIWNLFPKFYYGDLAVGHGLENDNDTALIILENLSASGYHMTKLRSFLDIEELRLIVKKLAHFHAFSYYAKSKSPKDFHSVVSNLVETNFVDTGVKQGYINIASDYYIDVLSKDERYSEKAELIRDLLKDADKFMRDIYTTAPEPMAVVCHGDFLRNNLMIKYDSAGHPADVKFFDLACCRYSSPVVDLALILYMNTDQKTRDLYWDELIDVYCSSLREPFPDNDVPSRQQIVEEFKIKSLSAYAIVSFFLPSMMRYDEIPNYELTYRDCYLPEFAEFVHTPWPLLPNYVERAVRKKITKPHHEQVVLEVLKDIIDRGFV